MSTSAAEIAVSIARPFEGLRLSPYLCPAGIPTIGYGSTRYPDGRRVTLQDPPITREEAEAMLESEMRRCLQSAAGQCPVLILHAGCWGAIADFIYNLGAGRLRTSTLRRRINQQDWPEARRELMRWVRGGGRILPGLVRRRAAEAALLR
ncbi:MAG TPA: lysozyme [Sedimentisphaerales bacterium]|nr:lysozyme [Sedimentisphaerales bacterium]